MPVAENLQRHIKDDQKLGTQTDVAEKYFVKSARINTCFLHLIV